MYYKNSLTITLLLIATLTFSPLLTPRVHADDPPPDATDLIDNGDGLPNLDGVTFTNTESGLNQAQASLDTLSERRGARGDVRIEDSLPRLGMSQCDMNLIRNHQIDERVLKALNYLVQPTDKGGAGMTYLHVTFSKSCEQDVPDFIGNAYPVDFVDDAPKPSDKNKGLTNGQPTPSSLAHLQQSSFNNQITSVIAPLAEAATTKTSDVEPSDAQQVHDKGQAVDVLAAGLVMCRTKSGGVFGVGAKVSRQAPRPVKVSWQTDAGVSNVQAPFGNSFDQMAQTAGLDEFLTGFTSQDGSFQTHALEGTFQMMGFNLLANQLGIRPGSFNAQTDPLTYNTLGYALLADAMKLPDASVFNPYLSAENDQSNPFASKNNSTQTLLKRAFLSKFEGELHLPKGALEGKTFEEMLQNTGKRTVEQQLGLQFGSFRPTDITKTDDIVRALGQAKMETFYRWPIGSANSSGLKAGALTDLSLNVSRALGLPDNQLSYADSVVRGGLRLPQSANFNELQLKDSNFWKSDAGKKTREDVRNLDRQLFPGANGGTKAPALFDSGKLQLVDTITSKSTDDLTYRMITGDLSISDYQTIIGVGALLQSYGAYTTAGRALDLPEPRLPITITADGKVNIADLTKNNFLLKLLGGDKNHWVALGVNTIAKALNTHPDERYKSEFTTTTINANPRPIPAEKITGIVADALQGKLDTIRFSSAKASTSINLNPNDFLTVIGSSLARDSTIKNASTLAQQRFNTLVQLGKEQFGNVFDTAAKSIIGDSAVSGALVRYDQSRPATHASSETFTVGEAGQASFVLSQPATSITKISAVGEVGFELKGSMKNDKRTIAIDQTDAARLSGGDTLTIEYVGFAQKNSNGHLNTDTFSALINDPKNFASYALQIGAAKTSTALGLAPNALSLAASIIDPHNKSGIASVGQASLEHAAGLEPGTLVGTLDEAIKKGTLTSDQVNRMLHLEAGWYDKIVAHDNDFLTANATQLYNNDNYYKIDLGSTQQLLIGEITLDQYKKRIGNSQLKYNAGGILASQFSIHLGGYKLSAEDFTDLIDGSYYTTLNRIGARMQERNRGLPIGSLAASVISGKNDVSLWSLGTNFVASNFHLKSIDLSHANSIADVKNAIGVSAVEQALGFKENTFSGKDALEVAQSTGAENFVHAYGITLPGSVTNELNAVNYNYHSGQAQQDRDTIVLNYLKGKIGPQIGAEARFDQNTLQRFEAIDHTLGVEKGATLKFMQYQSTTADYVHATSVKAVDNRVTTGLAEILGIDSAYVVDTKDMIHFLTDNSSANDPKAFASLYDIVQKAGGLNFDASLGWDKGAFKHLLDNYNNPLELKKTFVAQGAKRVAKYLGLNDGQLGDLELRLANGSSIDYEQVFSSLGDGYVTSKIGVAGFTVTDADKLLTGHFADGATLVGAALMSKSKDMQAAGITYDDIKLSIYGNKANEDHQAYLDYVEAAKDSGLLGADKEAESEIISLIHNKTGYQSSVESSTRKYMTDARQSISFKFMDYEVRQLLPGVAIPVGFAKAMIGGLYLDTSNGQSLLLKGDEARQRMGQLLVVDYLKTAKTPLKDILSGVPDPVVQSIGQFIQDQDSQRLQQKLAENKNAGFLAVGQKLDPLISGLFGNVAIAPGTSAALLGFASGGNVAQFQKDMWRSWQFQAFDFADKAIGLKPGTANVMYQGIVGYQEALKTFQMANLKALTELDRNFNNPAARQIFSNKTNAASRQLKTQTAMIITAVANIVFQKQIAQVEGALGLKPGTMMYLIQYLIHPDPISLGLFIFFNFIWGGSSTACEIDHYPGSPAPVGVQMLQAALKDTQTSADASAAFDNANKSVVNPIDKALTPPKSFNGQDNDSYRKGIKAGAQYEVRRTLGSLLLMPTRTNDVNLTPIQIGTYSNDDMLLFEKLSVGLYGPIQARGKKGPGTYNLMTDRIHLGY